jgi:oligoribonuclease NrnB/cAMP/cGMP phosphodiesterase (DHH superfamily)
MSGVLMKNLCEVKDIKYDLIPYNYESLLLNLSLYSHLLFCDISPEYSWIEVNWKGICDNNIHIEIYDHHKSQIDNIEKIFKKIKGINLDFRDYSIYDGHTCGCKVFLNNHKDIFGNKYWDAIISIISSYDTWTFDNNKYLKENEFAGFLNKQSIIDFYSYLLLLNMEQLENFMCINFFSPYINLQSYEAVPYTFKSLLNGFIKNGSLITKRNDIINREEIKKGYYGDDIVIFNGTHSANTGKIIEEIYGKVIVSVAIKINFSINKTIFSIRSYDENKFDASNFCKLFGGGGHPGASGFSLNLKDGFELFTDNRLIGAITDMIIWK